jgi:hypothetical protein
LGELKEIVGVGDRRLLSNFLAFKAVRLSRGSEEVKVFVRVNIPLPRFPIPHLHLKVDSNFILKEIGAQLV